MSFIGELYQTGFLNIRKLWHIGMAKRVHGSNLSFLLRFAATFYKNKTALSDGSTTISFKELYVQVLQCAAAIKKTLNCKGGETIILRTENTLQHIIVLYAVQNLGVCLILVSSKAHAAELRKMKEKLRGKSYILSKEPIGPDTVLLDTLFADVNTKETAVSKKYAPIIYTTSGTTGAAKMIEKRKGAFYWLRAFTDLLTYTGIHQRQAVYIAVPVSHGFGSTALLFALVLGKKAVVAGNKSWEQQGYLIEKEKIDLLAGVPASLFYLAENIKDTKTVKLVITGGAPLTETAFEKLTACFGYNIFSMYGSTEASTSFVANYAALKKNIHALGRPLKNVQYKLAPLANGGHELLIQSKLANIGGTDNWLSTGDVVMEAEGLLIWCGRKDDMIIKGGVNIYPAEIEDGLLKVPGIIEVMVTGYQHPIKGEVLAAFIRTENDFLLHADELRQHLRQTLSGIKIPDLFFVVEGFEYTHTGKKIKPISPSIA